MAACRSRNGWKDSATAPHRCGHRQAASGARSDWRSVGAGVWEIRLHFGPGYRVYCGQRGTEFILLLCGGDKGSTQARDIETAHDYWKDYKARTR